MRHHINMLFFKALHDLEDQLVLFPIVTKVELAYYKRYR